MSKPYRLFVTNARSVPSRETTAYVGPGSRWATPFLHQNVASSPDEVAKFRDWLHYGPESKHWVDGDPVKSPYDTTFGDWPKWLEMIRLLHTLRGKYLADTTPLDWPSHADVLLEVANGPDLPKITVSWEPV